MDQTMADAMAKTTAGGRARRERKPVVVQIRAGSAWQRWAEDVAEREALALTMLCDRAMREYARNHGYPDPPRR